MVVHLRNCQPHLSFSLSVIGTCWLWYSDIILKDYALLQRAKSIIFSSQEKLNYTSFILSLHDIAVILFSF